MIVTLGISEYIVTNPDMQDMLDHLESKLKVCDEDSKLVGAVPHSTVGEVEVDKFEKVEQ